LSKDKDTPETSSVDDASDSINKLDDVITDDKTSAGHVAHESVAETEERVESDYVDTAGDEVQDGTIIDGASIDADSLKDDFSFVTPDSSNADLGAISSSDLDEAQQDTTQAYSPSTSKKSFLALFFSGLLLTLKGLWRITKIAMLAGIVLGAFFGAAYVLKLDDKVQKQFEGKRWALPARVFARPLELYVGQRLRGDDLQKELQLLNYSFVTRTVGTGQYQRQKNKFVVQTRGFKFAEDSEIARRISIEINNGEITKLTNVESNELLTLMRLEPVLIGNFYPRHNEDRVLVRSGNVPSLLTKGLVAVEDKTFREHYGVNPKSILRALLANIKAGKNTQGGSTLTQQLVKNFYLSSERSYKRKANEAVMALLLEYHYDKDEILEAYMNEIYLGQNKKRAIHGFGLASQFYFNRPITEVKPEQIALLIGLAKGASFYDPRRNPKRATKRRNLVIDIMAREGVINKNQATQLKAQPLGVTAIAPPSVSPFPAYLELVREQLQRDYQEEDLRSEGLLIFTAMDPIVQITAEQVLSKGVARLEKAERIPKGKLNGALVLTSVQGAEIQAVVGGRNARLAGYNRALSASRQIGSLVKPAIYLAGLEAKQYHLGSSIDGGPVTVKLSKNKLWKPKNYSGKDLGMVSFESALVKSMNTPTVRIGINLGLDKVITMLHALGIEKEIQENPSLLLGAIELTPIEVQQMYHTLAASGTYTQMKAIRSVMNSYGKTLKRYPLQVKQVTGSESVYLLNHAMNKVTKEGTARYLSAVLPKWKNSAGKTGTTNKSVDSWFAGYTGQHVLSVWVGRDDNKPAGLTGASGALRVWADLIKNIQTKPFKPKRPKGIKYVKIDKRSGLLFNPSCGEFITLPFKKGTEPKKKADCMPVFDNQEYQAPQNKRPTWEIVPNKPRQVNNRQNRNNRAGSVWNGDKRVEYVAPNKPPIKEIYKNKKEADKAATRIQKQWTPPARSQPQQRAQQRPKPKPRENTSPDSDTGEWIDNLMKR